MRGTGSVKRGSMTQSSGYPYATRGSSGSSGRTCVLTLYEIRTTVDSVAKPFRGKTT
jgi:hypothetical protein